MSGTTHSIVSLRSYDFSKLQAGETQDIPLCRAFDVTGAKQIDVSVKVTSRTITGGQIDVIVQAVALSGENPSVDYVYTTLAAGVVALATITLNVAAPVLQLATLTPPWGSMVRVILRGTGAAAATITTSLDVDLIVYDN